ncbi:MAG: hypothetical protein FE78DRAFT_87181 [Acidomyces sp. 'richmondensis']|nr:MAG: hypothetical protein FE78DRAFT_87181 [Acidomyces sp. 'richmondensis']
MNHTNYTLPASGSAQQYGNTSPDQPARDPAVHQRTYQACIPCRRRKVRCDLGSVDNPHDPPCVRCRREAKECFFSATRRRNNKQGTGTDIADEEDVYEIKNGRKRARTSSSIERHDGDYDEPPRTPGGGRGQSRPLRRPEPQRPVQYTEEDQKVGDQTAAVLQSAEVHSGHDALKLLSHAAHFRERFSQPQGDRPMLNGVSPSSLPPATSPIMDPTSQSSYKVGPMAMANGIWKTAMDSDGRSSIADGLIKSQADIAAYNSALKAWSRFRFVRAGWFTAKEGIDYVIYFYKYLSPLTPVALPDFSPCDTHEQLLTQEPMLAITILLISSRHMKLDGPGAQSRPYAIHDKLWKYLAGMINRLVWGQEQFGGGFCGAGAEPAADVNPLSRKGLRTLGTVESLVLLTEWHPRAMHFPPDEADEELMIPDHPVSTPSIPENSDVPKGIGGQRMDAWLEPCWRSDRMCWMLLGMAMSLAIEIGVFDQTDWQRHAKAMNGEPLSAEGLNIYDKRRRAVRDLLLVYVTQTSGRLGLTSMLPSNYSKPEDSPQHRLPLDQHESIQETVLYFWLHMADMISRGNTQIFANKQFTRDLIKNGDYTDAIDKLQEPLLQWRKEFDQCVSIPKYMRYILEIEYEYCRVYINALALQAIAERCANLNEQPLSQILDPPIDMVRSSAITTNGVRTDVAIDPHTLSKSFGRDRKYMVAVGDAARRLLKVVVDGLYPGDYLRHAPVRTYFRIISVAIMLLKSFSLGATESDVSDSLSLMDRTVEALKTCIVDDVHVASRFAELLNKLTEGLKPRLIRISADGRNGRSRRVSTHDSPMPMATPLNNANQRGPGQNMVHGQTMPPAVPHQQQQWNYTSFVPSSNASSTPANPLLGVSNQTYDLFTENDYSVMPPPSFNFHSPTMSTGTGNASYSSYSGPGTFGNDTGVGDWLTLPLDNLLNASADVESSMYGPQVGGADMLELLLAGTGQGQNGY